MSQGGIQTLIATIAGVLLAASVYFLARRGRLSFRYTVGWLVLCLLGIGAIILLLAICVQFSISISGMQEQIRRLTEEAAETKLRFEEHQSRES